MTEQKKELLQVLEDTSGPRKAMFAARTIPDDYRAFLNMVEQTEEVLTLPGAAVPAAAQRLSEDSNDFCRDARCAIYRVSACVFQLRFLQAE